MLHYVDDIVVTSDNPKWIQWLISQIQTQLSIKYVGFPRHFLGPEVLKLGDDIFLSQQHDTLELLYCPVMSKGCHFAHLESLYSNPMVQQSMFGGL